MSSVNTLMSLCCVLMLLCFKFLFASLMLVRFAPVGHHTFPLQEGIVGAFDMDCGCMKRQARVAACSRGGVENGSVKLDLPASRGLLR